MTFDVVVLRRDVWFGWCDSPTDSALALAIKRAVCERYAAPYSPAHMLSGAVVVSVSTTYQHVDITVGRASRRRYRLALSAQIFARRFHEASLVDRMRLWGTAPFSFTLVEDYDRRSR